MLFIQVYFNSIVWILLYCFIFSTYCCNKIEFKKKQQMQYNLFFSIMLK